MISNDFNQMICFIQSKKWTDSATRNPYNQWYSIATKKNHEKYLDLHMYTYLSWKYHVNHIKSKLVSLTGLLRSIGSYLYTWYVTIQLTCQYMWYMYIYLVCYSTTHLPIYVIYVCDDDIIITLVKPHLSYLIEVWGSSDRT